MTTTTPAAADTLREISAAQPFDAKATASAMLDALEHGAAEAELREWFKDVLAADAADALKRLPEATLVRVFSHADATIQARIVRYLPRARQIRLVLKMPPDATAALLARMSPDDRADLYNALPEGRESLLPALAQAERDDIRRLAGYREGRVGAIMTSQYAALAPELSASEAIEELRRVAPDRETIYNAYVIDAERRLIGVTTLRRLILADPATRIADMMKGHVVAVAADAPQAKAAELIARYDFIAIPVVDAERRLVGIVTADDAIDVIEAEATEDFQKQGGTLGDWPVRMRDAGIRLLYRKRVFWLVLLVFANVFSGAGIAYFEDLIAANVALVFFLPLLIDSGGNAGSQSATLMVRALATGDVELRDWAGMLGRELTVAALLGLTMALAVSVVGVFRAGPAIALVVALTMMVVVLVGSVVGMSLPFLISRFRGDPASASSPLITTIADASGIVIYFGIASAVLPELPGG